MNPDLRNYDIESEMRSKVDGFEPEAQVMCWKLLAEVARLEGILKGLGYPDAYMPTLKFDAPRDKKNGPGTTEGVPVFDPDEPTRETLNRYRREGLI